VDGLDGLPGPPGQPGSKGVLGEVSVSRDHEESLAFQGEEEILAPPDLGVTKVNQPGM